MVAVKIQNKFNEHLEIIESFFDDDCINLSDITEAMTTNHSLW